MHLNLTTNEPGGGVQLVEIHDGFSATVHISR